MSCWNRAFYSTTDKQPLIGHPGMWLLLQLHKRLKGTSRAFSNTLCWSSWIHRAVVTHVTVRLDKIPLVYLWSFVQFQYKTDDGTLNSSSGVQQNSSVNSSDPDTEPQSLWTALQRQLYTQAFPPNWFWNLVATQLSFLNRFFCFPLKNKKALGFKCCFRPVPVFGSWGCL